VTRWVAETTLARMPLSGCQRVETGHGRQGSRGFFFLTLRYHADVTSRERMDAAMRPAEGLTPDRVPVMCQLSLGHYFLNSGLPPVDIWHDSGAFAEALVTLQRRYGFDGILINLPGRDPAWRDAVVSTEARGTSTVIRWKEELTTVVPADDTPRVLGADQRKRKPPALADIDPDRLFYIEPHDRLGVVAISGFPPPENILAIARAVEEPACVA